MLALISPAKKLDFESQIKLQELSQPNFLDEANLLVKKAKTLSKQDLARSMKLSESLAELNFQRFKNFSVPFNLANAKQAAFAFKGDTYIGLNIDSFSNNDIQFAQKHLRILSGLYGILRPLDLIQPYRLEMGARFQPPKSSTLYDFWGDHITNTINTELMGHDNRTLINLASNEYFKVIKVEKVYGKIITPVFKEIKKGKIRTLGMFAKRARGMMGKFIVNNRLKSPDGLKRFNEQGYSYKHELSNTEKWVFTRPQP